VNLICVYVFPLTAFISGLFNGAEPFSFASLIKCFSSKQLGIFTILYMTPILVGMLAKEKAMNLYDEIVKNSNPSSVGLKEQVFIFMSQDQN
jgi:hypothetical protein